MYSKKAQSEVITTVLIILLVLAAIIIVWQVVQSTLNKGAEQVTSGANCMGVSMDVQQLTGDLTGTKFVIKRGPQGDVFNGADLSIAVLANGVTVPLGGASGLRYSYDLTGAVASDFKDLLTSRVITIAGNTTGITQVETALKLKGAVCGASGTWTP